MVSADWLQSPNRRAACAALIASMLLLAPGCERTPATRATEEDVAARVSAFVNEDARTTPSVPPAPAPVVAAPEAGPAAGPDATGTADGPSETVTGPMNDKDRAKAEAWAAAIDGLRIENGILAVTNAQPDAEAVIPALERGAEALLTNHTTAAVQAFADAVRAAPNDIDANLGLARALVRKSKLELAEAAYRRVLMLDEGHLDARIEFAEALGRDDRRPEAIDAMYLALQIDPESGRAHQRLAVWLYYEQAYERAWEHVQAAQAVDFPVPPQFLAQLKQRL